MDIIGKTKATRLLSAAAPPLPAAACGKIILLFPCRAMHAIFFSADSLFTSCEHKVRLLFGRKISFFDSSKYRHAPFVFSKNTDKKN